MKTKPSSEENSLAPKVKAARERLGWSLAEVARRTGLSRAYVNAIENGRTTRPGADVVRRLEDVFGPLVTSGSLPEDLPGGLRMLAQERQLPESEVKVLAGLRIQGKQPLSADRWRFIYDAMVTSEAMEAKDDR